MKHFLLFSLSALLSLNTHAQDLLNKAFEELVGSTWVCDTVWSNGQKFHQEVTYQFDLDKSIVHAETIGFLDPSGNTLGKRNYGIRYRSEHPDTLNFIEFDVHGGATKGLCFMLENDLYYRYSYETELGTTFMTERYKKIDENTLEYIIGIFENGEWTFKYLSTYFRKKI